ncbi:MAG TPA: polysaccharide biosynthesis C-terminal domain-containing protein [Puia sp.]|nr:polysaccharide biosynthesis C-terminal domain-containing protein [Puia sp.]
MASIKKLASQTLWYGASSIFARFLYYLLTPYLTGKFSGTVEYGRMSLVFALIPFLFTLIVFAFETAYFRFMERKEYKMDVYNTLSTSLLISTVAIIGLTIFYRASVAAFIGLPDHPEYITLCAAIIGFDALSALPFAKLRHENRPKKFAFIRITGILLNIFVVYFFLTVCPSIIKKNPNSILHLVYSARFGVAYVLIANAAASLFQFLALSREWSGIKLHINKILWKEVMIYALPLTIAGFAGMINETFDRVMLQRWSPLKGDAATFEVGVYSACYKLSILITLFVQAFRMGAEPFFFKQSSQENAPKVYARVMKFFVITICGMFLFVSLYLNIWKILFIRDEKMWAGIKVVPILLLANMFLGIYINLSIWYRLTRKTTAGAYITLIGAGITIAVNFIFIPYFSYMACAWATFLCYGTMMVISYLWGQKSYPVPYAWKKLVAYIVIVVILYFIHRGIISLWHNMALNYTIATLFLILFGLFIYQIEKKEFENLLRPFRKTS